MSDFPLLISAHELLHLFFSPPALLRRRNEKGAGWVYCSQPKANHHNSFLAKELGCWAPCRECQSWSGMAMQWWLPLGCVWISHPELGVVSHALFLCSNSINFRWVLNGFSLVLFSFHVPGYATAALVCLPSHIPYFLQSLQKTTSSTCLAKPRE